MPSQFDKNGNVIIPKTMKFNEFGQPEETVFTVQDKRIKELVKLEQVI
ncbi:MAG: hypothetical protein OIN86_13130 [Candidatus Methanoperedens sp.]|nr:hypothetical protein [Candidatus Methanoperedens sp.]CAG0949106.1 hypothetical protein METP1_00081 [Methanosarcinales archaeon]